MTTRFSTSLVTMFPNNKMVGGTKVIDPAEYLVKILHTYHVAGGEKEEKTPSTKSCLLISQYAFYPDPWLTTPILKEKTFCFRLMKKDYFEK